MSGFFKKYYLTIVWRKAFILRVVFNSSNLKKKDKKILLKNKRREELYIFFVDWLIYKGLEGFFDF
ncbi:hypothetical protein QRE66_27745 (plasmid) [Bacillus cereus]|nr:hypothetical protein QRE66_27745 [Bacillus cereus]